MLRSSRKFSLQTLQIHFWSLVLQSASYLGLLGLCAAATHG